MAEPEFIPDAEEAPFVPDEPAAAAAPADDRGFLARAWDSIKSGAHAVKHVGGELATHPIDTLKDPAKRHELERGIGDVVTLGYGNRLAARVGNALGDVSRGTSLNETQHFSADPTQGNVSAPSEIEAREAAAAPEFRTAGQVAGSFLPNPAGKLAGAVTSKVVSPLAGAFSKVIGAPVANAAAKVPFVGPALAAGADALGGAAKGIAGYEATAPATAALGAGAEGHRLEAAKQAATDPAGLLLSGTAGALPAAGKRAAGEAASYANRAADAADEWIAKDLQGEAKGASTPTARRQMMRAADNFPDLIGGDEELRGAIYDARHGNAAKVAKAEEVVSRRLDETQEPKADLYKQADAALPRGGVRVGDVVAGYQHAIDELEATGLDLDAQVAGELKGRLKKIMGARDWGAEKSPTGLSEKAQSDLTTLETVRKNMDGRPGFDPKPIDDQIAAIKASAKTATTFNPDQVVSTRQLRRLVTDAQRTAFDREGGINGTERYNRAIEVAAVPEKILDEHLGHAAQSAPDVVARIKQMDADTHTLLAAKKVLVQRLDHARLNAAGVGTPVIPHSIKQAAHGSIPLTLAATAYTGHPGLAALGAAVVAAPAVKRVMDTKIAKFVATPQGERAVARLVHAAATSADTPAAIQRAVSSGIPAAVAQRIADISRQTFAPKPADASP